VAAENAEGKVVRVETLEAHVRPGKTRFVFFNSLK
jgi:hypothetical protein